ncbi:MAG TPA: TadE/TadG family type IV pilus assembly protein [Rhizomicrobium sp.]|jgi:Flp pilus assembly protein TadG|nr:TadE/TadG family type IV pilus assembly protein [Rhizomicrobium sp.]
MRRLLQFLTRESGSIAVEFAFIAPVMIGMFFGLNELALALGAKADVFDLTSAGADLVAQESAVTTADMTNVFSALSAMLYPYSTASAQITISSVIDNNTATTGKVAWSCSQGGTARAANSVYTFPTAARGVITQGGGGSVIMNEVTYSYSLPFVVTIPGVINLTGPYAMTDTFYSKPRRVAQIPMGACP